MAGEATPDATLLGAEFAAALAAKDFARAASLLHPEVDFAALTPRRAWDAHDPQQVVADVLRVWFDDACRARGAGTRRARDLLRPRARRLPAAWARSERPLPDGAAGVPECARRADRLDARALLGQAADRVSAPLPPGAPAALGGADALLAYDREHVWHPYAALPAALAPLLVESAEGVRLRLADGRELIDGMASWWCAIHGYRHPRARRGRARAARPHGARDVRRAHARARRSRWRASSSS